MNKNQVEYVGDSRQLPPVSGEYSGQIVVDDEAKHNVSANVALVGGVVELSSQIDEAIGFEPESVWPVIAMLWDMNGYKGVYDMGVIGVWMAGLGCMLYVCSMGTMSGVHSYE